MTETAIDDLYEIMRDQKVGMHIQLNAAISASRVERLAMSGETEPEAVLFLRYIIDFEEHPEGKAEKLRFSPQFRREAAAALAYYERRTKKAELTYNVADLEERHEKWRLHYNGRLRLRLWDDRWPGYWPQYMHIQFRRTDQFEMPALDPDKAIGAMLLGTVRQGRRRQRTIDERVATGGCTKAERAEIQRVTERVVAKRLKEFGVTIPEAEGGSQ